MKSTWRVQKSSRAEDLRLDVVHVGPLGQLDPVILHGALAELGKGLRDLGAVIGLVVVPADLDAVAPDVDAVPDLGQPLQKVAGVAHKPYEAVCVPVVREVLTERSKSS
jgi:hypothetical protein